MFAFEGGPDMPFKRVNFCLGPVTDVAAIQALRACCEERAIPLEGRTRGENSGYHWRCGGLVVQWDEAFTVVARFSWPLKASRSSSVENGLIRRETPCPEIETAVCPLFLPSGPVDRASVNGP